MDDYILSTCKKCGNKGLQKIVAQYDQHTLDYVDDNPIGKIDDNWILLECPVCENVCLYRKRCCDYDYMCDDQDNRYCQESVLYPQEKSFPNVPKDILKSYEAAKRTATVDLSVSLIAIRAVLEKICKERGTNRKTLEAMLKQMVERHILPETLDKCSFVIRKMGNSGAHGDDDSLLTTRDIAELIDFIETIMYYIYELPVKVVIFNKKYNLKIEEHEAQQVQGTDSKESD